MRVLVAAACIAVLAAVSYYFWSEYAEAQARSSESAKVEEIRKDLFSFAGVDHDDTEGVIKFCRSAEFSLDGSFLSSDTRPIWRQAVKNCRYLGYL